MLLVIRGAARRVPAGLALLALLGTLVTLVLGIGDLTDGDHSITGWYWTALVVGVLASGCAALAVPFSPTWPAMSGRYDAPGAAAPKAPESDADLWKAQDQGHDPS